MCVFVAFVEMSACYKHIKTHNTGKTTKEGLEMVDIPKITQPLPIVTTTDPQTASLINTQGNGKS